MYGIFTYNFPYIYQTIRPHIGKYTTEVYHDHGPYGYSKLFKQKTCNLHVHLEFARFLWKNQGLWDQISFTMIEVHLAMGVVTC